jgi:hypothetical protein
MTPPVEQDEPLLTGERILQTEEESSPPTERDEPLITGEGEIQTEEEKPPQTIVEEITQTETTPHIEEDKAKGHHPLQGVGGEAEVGGMDMADPDPETEQKLDCHLWMSLRNNGMECSTTYYLS